MEHNRKYADAAGVIFQRVANDTGRLVKGRACLSHS